MAESLFDVIRTDYVPLRDVHDAGETSLNYLDRLSTLSLSALTTTEPEALGHDAQSSLRSLQVLSKRSHQSIDIADRALSHLKTDVPFAFSNASSLQNALPSLETSATRFAEKYSKLSNNPVLDRRKRILRLGENVERLSDILELPTLLSSIISASSSAATSQIGAPSTSTSSANANYATALDLHAHIRRLQRLYPESQLIKSISQQAETAMRDMASSLISSLRSPNLKLAGGMRLIGLLRRIAPDLDDQQPPTSTSSSYTSTTSKPWTPSSFSSSGASNASEGSLGALFLILRLSNLLTTLSALEPLQELADQDFSRSKQEREKNPWAAGQQTERYLKRYIEVFREQCFAIVSMYKSVFPNSLPGPTATGSTETVAEGGRVTVGRGGEDDDDSSNLPPALATFTPHIIHLLLDTLRRYLPNIRDQSSRDSLLTQVLYCSASLGRLGGDFGLMFSLLDEEQDENEEDQVEEKASGDEHVPEWIEAMRKHRVQAGRLEMLAAGRRGSEFGAERRGSGIGVGV